MSERKSLAGKIFAGIFCIVILVCIGFGIYWIIQNIESIKAGVDGTKIYTQQEYDANYERGVQDGAVIKTEQDTLIANLKKQIDSLNATQKDLKLEIETKNERISELESSNSSSSSEKTRLEAEVARLNGLVSNLQTDINYYIAKIEELQTENEVFAYFSLDTEGSDIHYTKVLSKGNTISDNEITPPSNTTYKKFIGWSLDKINVISLADYPINADTTFYAVWEDIAFDVQFVSNNKVIKSEIVSKNGQANAPNNPSYSDINHTFSYWTPDNGVTKLYGWIFVQDYPITQNTTFVAVFREIDPYLRVILNGKLRAFEEKEFVTDDLSEKNLTTAQVYPIIALAFDSGGYTEITETANLPCYDIYITSTDTQVIVNLNNKTYTYDKLDNSLTMVIEFKIRSTGYKDDSVNYSYNISV